MTTDSNKTPTNETLGCAAMMIAVVAAIILVYWAVGQALKDFQGK